MNRHAFAPRAAAAAMATAILLAGGAATGASAAVSATPAPVSPQVTTTTTAQQDTPTAPGAPTGLTATPGNGTATLSWSAPSSDGGLKSGDGYLIYMGTSPGGEGANPSVRYLIENTTSYTIAPLTDGIRYYFQVALLDGNNRLSARSAEVSAVPGVGAGAAAGPPPGVGPGGKAGIGKAGQPSAAPLPSTDAVRHHALPSLPAGLIILLAALSLAATGGAIAIVLVQRRRRRDGRGYAPVPAPRRPHDDQPAGPPSRMEELNGPRYR